MPVQVEQNPLQVEGANPGIATTREQRATTEYSVEQRQRDSGSSLLGQRIEVQGRGTGVVLDVVKAKGKATEHLIMFDDGKREAVLLSKERPDTSARSKGHRFWLLHNAVQVLVEPSRSQC